MIDELFTGYSHLSRDQHHRYIKNNATTTFTIQRNSLAAQGTAGRPWSDDSGG